MSDLDPLDETRDLASGDLVKNDGVKLETIPDTIGRYRIDKVLGKGGFGLVYLAYDDQLSRPVAIKVPHGKLITQPSDAEAYLTEARTVANLDHPHIVPVHDVGSTDDFPCFVVSKYVEGTDLSKKLKLERLTYTASAELVATVAEALHYAHKQGLVHRDVKPGNILLDTDEKPYVVDFGLALREENIGKGPRYAGTPVYMSPEQARGEGHRVDGRSDIFSLGVMLYEMLVGRRPFQAETQQELLEQITTMEAKPPRQIDDAVPKELERICLKAISKRASDRYTTAQDFSDDLKHYLDKPPSGAQTETFVPQVAPPTGSESTRIGADSDTPKLDSDSQPIRIVPKGLRSFDAHDADFFLELLPGPRDREGLPDSLRFWKTRIEETDPDETFSIGLIYGPSGCGKSSLVKAGLLPRLNENVIPVYVEATPDDTETRLLHGLRKRCPALDGSLNLKETMTALRRGQDIPTGKKVLIVLDQFEQWLHAKKEEHNTELVQALRQCDGGKVQCIVMVRDDFWMAVTRFLREMEVKLVEDKNLAAVDLFPERHARKVLAAFGQAFGALPSEISLTTKEQKEFLKQSVKGLAEEGKVICVRLALFADMMKGKAWTHDTFKDVGGTKGIGVTFLEETFSSSTASPEHRLHQKAARAVLKALLPDSGSDIKGEMNSYDELLEASGYATRAKDFDDLVKILDSEIRLITPTDPEGVESDDDSESQFETSQKYYQLTHDYLVPSLRDWLTRKQRETRRGRAELRLAERSVTWNAKPENRQLPSTLEWLRIHALTNHSNWNDPQRKMMQRANRVKAMFWSGVFVLMVIAGIGIQQTMRGIAQQNTKVAVNSLQAATGSAVPIVLKILKDLPDDLVLKELQKRFPESTGQPKLSLAYGLAAQGQVEIDAIVAGISDEKTKSEEMQYIVIALKPQGDQAITKLKSTASDVTKSQTWAKARLAIISMYLDDLTIAEEMLTATKPDPIQRTTFISEFPEWAFDIEALTENIDRMENAHFRSGICLSLGGIDIQNAKYAGAKDAWKSILENWYLEAPDGGTHSAAGWALSQWKLNLPNVDETPRPEEGRDWWHAKLELKALESEMPTSAKPRLRFVKIPSGSVQGEEGPIVVSNEYWLSDIEITVGLFQRFIDDEDYTGLKPKEWEGAVIFGGDKSPDLPVQQVNWFDAVMFCNWLSWKLGLEACYEIEEQPDEKRNRNEPYTVRIPDPAADGIRLPTGPEWEFACRAQTTKKFSFGDDEYRLVDYGWYERNSSSRTHQTGAKRCNAWGLFDMHGNVYEWCWGEGSDRVIRGGSWSFSDGSCQSSYRIRYYPTDRFIYLGFRVARARSASGCCADGPARSPVLRLQVQMEANERLAARW